MQLTLPQLVAIMPNARSQAGIFLPVLNAAMAEFSINTPARQAAFLATVGHESRQLAAFTEGLNYSAAGLLATFAKYFTPAEAMRYERQPERIAHRVSANRGGNRDEASGDGWRNRGAGAFQLTVEDNHVACAKYFGIARSEIGAWLRTPAGALRSAGWFWMVNNVNRYADQGDFDGVCDVVNRGRKTMVIGDAIGWVDRLSMFKRATTVLAATRAAP